MCLSLLRSNLVRSNLVLRNLVDVGTGCGSQTEARVVGSVAFAGAARAIKIAPAFEAHHRSRGRLAAGGDGSGESKSEDSEELHFGVLGW